MNTMRYVHNTEKTDKEKAQDRQRSGSGAISRLWGSLPFVTGKQDLH